MNGLVRSAPFAVALTLGAYALGVWLQRRTKLVVLHPVLTALLVVVAVLRFVQVDVATYAEASRAVTFFLGPSVVALGVLLHLELEAMRDRLGRILLALSVGSVVGVVSVVLIARFLGAPSEVVATLAPKSATTPIAMSISASVGGIPALTAVIVILVGVFGAAIGPFVLSRIGVRSPAAIGLALGASAHGVGTARAAELGSVEGAGSALAVTLHGLATSLVTAPLLHLLSP